MNNKKLIWLVAPSLLITTLISLYPTIYAIWISLCGGKGGNLTYVGGDNYTRLLKDEVYKETLFNSCQFVLLIVPMIFFISICIASFIHHTRSNKIKGLLSAVVYIPCITSPVAYTLFYKQLAYPDGILSNFLYKLRIVPQGFNVLQNEIGAKLYIAFICIWAWSGFYILMLYSAMSNTDINIYRAALLDGASSFKTYRKIILPTIRPVLLLVLLLSTCSTFQIYAEVALLTKGGPNESTYTLALYLYRKTFVYVADYGYASAIGITVLIISATISLAIYKIRKKAV